MLLTWIWWELDLLMILKLFNSCSKLLTYDASYDGLLLDNPFFHIYQNCKTVPQSNRLFQSQVTFNVFKI